MCVIERETFQRILTRYPHDREIVLNSIVHHTMLHLAADHVPCMLLQMVRNVVPTATVSSAIKLMARAINPRESDPTIVFGVTEQLTSRLQALAPRYSADGYAESRQASDDSIPHAVHGTTIPSAAESELFRMAREMQAHLARIEERQLHSSRAASRRNNHRLMTAARHNSWAQSIASNATLIRVPPTVVRSKPLRRPLHRDAVKSDDLQDTTRHASKRSSREPTSPSPLAPDSETAVKGVPETSTPLRAPKRMLQDLVVETS